MPGSLTNVSAIASGNYHGLALTPGLGQLLTSLSDSGLVLRWSGSGTLQWAPSPLGTYTDIACPGTCYTNVDMSAPAKFFRLRR